MLLAFKIENFAGVNETFSFIAESQKKFPKQVIVRENLSKKIKVLPCIGFTHTEKTSRVFKALYFIRQLVIRTNAGLDHENIQKYLPLIEDTATFRFIFLGFTNYYQYCVTLSKNEIVSEALYRFDNDREDIFTIEDKTKIFIRNGQEYADALHTENLQKYDIMPEKNQTLVSLFKEEDETFRELNEVHAWFRKTLLTFEDMNFIDYFSTKDYSSETYNVFDITKIKYTAKEIQPFIDKPMSGYFQDLEKAGLRLELTKEEIYFHGKTSGDNEIKLTIKAENNSILKFLTALTKIKKMPYAIFIAEDFTQKLNPLFAYLFIKAFLYAREEERSQFIFSSGNEWLLSKDIIRSDGLFFVDDSLEKTQKATEFENDFAWRNAIESFLPKKETKKRKRKKIKTSDLVLIVIVIIFLFYLYIK